MKEKNKPDNLEQFFQRVLGEYEEDPGEAFWDRIAPSIPPKPVGKGFVYKGWMLVMAFLGGLLLSSLFFYWQSNTQLLSNLEVQLVEKDSQIEVLKQQIAALQNSKSTTTSAPENEFVELNINEEITQPKPVLNPKNIGSPEKAKLNLANTTDKEPLIKLEIARKTGVVAAAPTTGGSKLQLHLPTMTKEMSRLFSKEAEHLNHNLNKNYRLLFDRNLISNSFFLGNTGDFTINEKAVAITTKEEPKLNLLPIKKSKGIVFDHNNFDLTLAEKIALFDQSKTSIPFNEEVDELTSFITGSINPLSSYKYNLAGYKAVDPIALGSVGIGSSWNWSFNFGFETKTKWSVQMGVDFNQLNIVRESVNNVRFRVEDARPVNGGYVYTSNQRTDGALGQVSVSSTILNQIRNDGNDVLDGDLFRLSIRTVQPVKVIRLPIMGGYRFDLSKRFYVTPKLGVSAVWKTKDQTQLSEVRTFSDRLSLQKSGIFLTTKTTTESLEANFRTEFGFKWRKRWYLVAEPRFKYGKRLFEYNGLELKDAPFHMMIGIRFNVD